MKRFLLLLLCFTLLLGGCANNKKNNPYTAHNEIFTYDRVDSHKTVITLGQAVSLNLNQVVDEFMRQNPDIQVVQMEMTGGNEYEKPWIDCIKNGDAPDLVMASLRVAKNVQQDKYFEDLTANPVVALYQPGHLKACTIDARLYCLPSPSSVTGLYCNKTLFEEYGWKIPDSFDAFVSLCEQITLDTKGAVRPWNANAKYGSGIINTLQGFAYGEYLGGVENRTWYHDFIIGKQTFESHMKPCYDEVNALFDKNLITVEDFSYSATQISKEFNSGKLAMFASTASKQYLDNGFELIPFPATNGEKGYFYEDVTHCLLKPLKERTEKENLATQKFLEFMSTKEAQALYTQNSFVISCLIDNNDEENGIPPAILSAQKEGRMFTPLDLAPLNKTPGYAPYTIIREGLLSIAKGEMTSEDALKTFDKAHLEIVNNNETIELDTIATALEDFTILETSTYFADMFKEKANADIGLCLNNTTYRGNLMKIYKGKMTQASINNLLMRSLANKSTLQKVRMTGAQILKVLNDPIDFVTNIHQGIYAVSGLKCTVAPWNSVQKRYIKVTLPDGTPLDQNKEYTVAFWEGTIKEEYVGDIIETYEGKFTDILKEKLLKDKTISPAKDGRMTLVWE